MRVIKKPLKTKNKVTPCVNGAFENIGFVNFNCNQCPIITIKIAKNLNPSSWLEYSSLRLFFSKIAELIY